jgi:trk system potassium uptake protein TrkH
VVLIGLMFVGRLGPAVFLTLLQTWQEPEHFAWPERSISIG